MHEHVSGIVSMLACLSAMTRLSTLVDGGGGGDGVAVATAAAATQNNY